MINDVRKATDRFAVPDSWKGLSTADGSWETLTVMFEDVPSKVRDLFKRRLLNPIQTEQQ